MPKIKSMNDIPSVREYLLSIGAEARSLRTAVIRENHGNYWTDKATVAFEKDGTVTASAENAYLLPDEALQKRICEEASQYEWPELQLAARWIKKDEPEELREAHASRIFTFLDTNENIIMKQVRTDNVRKGEKTYIPFTLWDDGEIRNMEPDGPLPLYGMEQLNQYATVFVHEGAKAARKCRDWVRGADQKTKDEFQRHPWYRELKDAAHLGWIGGADNPNRTDWKILKRLGVQKVFIVGDNDTKGQRAVQTIAKNIDLPTYHVQFTQQWPTSFDLADPFPAKMFNTIDGIEYYTGPSFRATLQPATYATKKIATKQANGKPGKPITVLRDHFKEQWVYVQNNDIFVCVEFPEIRHQEPIANKMLAPFSGMNNLCSMIVREYNGRHTRLTYRPDVEGRLIIDRDSTAVNLHTPTLIRSEPGDAKPFMDYLAYMFPNEVERKEVEKWCATLIAKPDVRMEYGLLLVSEMQGIGKTTLGAAILAPLVGMQNAGFPTESEIVDSNFNGWLANKRLILIGEIYSGHSWKAYNKLKSYITDKDVEVNEKYQRPYRVDNWSHIIACSNSKKALRIEEDDRRWFYPEVTEKRWSKKKFDEFRNWLAGGGLAIIKTWAENYGTYVSAGERAPMTERKKALIADSRSEAQKECMDLAAAMCGQDEPIALPMKDIEAWVRQTCQNKVFDSDLELRKAMHDGGATTYGKRLTIGGRTQYVMVNPKLWALGKNLDDGAFVELIRSNIKKTSDILGATM